jgi:hypothetical protein
MKTTDYKIISANTTDELGKQVKESIKNGWTLQGGVNTFVMHSPDAAYAISTQAMIK